MHRVVPDTAPPMPPIRASDEDSGGNLRGTQPQPKWLLVSGLPGRAGTTTCARYDATTEAFCYAEQNRLTWASSQSASGPCGASNTPTH